MTVPAATPSGWIHLARLLRPQGRKGEVLAELLTDFPERFTTQPRVYLGKPGHRAAPEQTRAAEVTNHWLPVGRNHGRVVLAFAGVCSITDAEALGGLNVIVPEQERIELDDEAEYIDDLLDCVVFDISSGTPVEVGAVEAVDFPLTPDGARRVADAAPLLTVRTADGAEVLIPYVRDFLVTLAVDRKRIEMKLPSGLIELNATAATEPETSADREPTA